MTEAPEDPETHSKLDLIESVANRVRRCALVELQRRTGAVEVKELATVTAAAVSDQELVDVSRQERDAVHWRLVHTHLQKLVEGGLVVWDDEAGTVATTDHSALRDDGFQQLLAVEAENWEAVLTALQSEPRRIAIDALAEAGALDSRELARRVAAREHGVDPAAVSEQRVDDARVSLYHVHLPILRDAGLVADDEGGETIRYDGHADLDTDWLAVASDAFDGDQANEGSDDRQQAGPRSIEIGPLPSGAVRSASSEPTTNSS